MSTSVSTDGSYVARLGSASVSLPVSQSSLRLAFAVLLITMPLFQFSLLNVRDRALLRLDWLGQFVFVGVVVAAVLARRIRMRPLSRISLLGVFFAYVSLLTMINLLDDPSQGGVHFATVAGALLLDIALFLIIAGLDLDPGFIANLMRLWVIAAVLMSCYATYQIFARVYSLPFAWPPYNNPSIGAESLARFAANAPFRQAYLIRPSGLLGEPSYLAAYLLPPLAFMFGYKYRSGGQYLLGSSARDLAAFAILLTGFVFSMSAGGLAALILTICVAALTRLVRTTDVARLAVLFVVSFLVLVVLSSVLHVGMATALLERATSLLAARSPEAEIDPSLQLRSRAAELGLDLWLHNPILGCGLGCLSTVGEASPQTLIAARAVPPWLMVLAEQGIVGGAVLVLLLVAILAGLHSRLRTEGMPRPTNLVIRGLYLLVWSEVFLSLSTHPWNTQPERWIALAIAASVAAGGSALQGGNDQGRPRFAGAGRGSVRQ
jgi:O-antigen ligase